MTITIVRNIITFNAREGRGREGKGREQFNMERNSEFSGGKVGPVSSSSHNLQTQ